MAVTGRHERYLHHRTVDVEVAKFMYSNTIYGINSAKLRVRDFASHLAVHRGFILWCLHTPVMS